MFNRIMVPVDLRHVDQMSRALDLSADLAKLYGASLVYVSVTTTQPSSVAPTPEAFAEKLAAYASAQGAAHGVRAEAHAMTSHDPSIDLEPTLEKALGEVKADLVVMASHVPGLADHIWPSNGGRLAAHAKCSVLVVRG